MIAVVAAVVGGLIVRLRVPLLSPILYILSRYRKDLFLISFLIYCLALGCELKIDNVYDINLMTIFATVLPSVLLLDSGMRGRDEDLIDYLLIPVVLAGLLVRELFIVGTTMAMTNDFLKDRPGKGVIVFIVGTSSLILGYAVCRGLFDLPGASPTQVCFASAIAIITALPSFWKKVKTTQMFNLR